MDRRERITQALPELGRIVIFNRSHAEADRKLKAEPGDAQS